MVKTKSFILIFPLIAFMALSLLGGTVDFEKMLDVKFPTAVAWSPDGQHLTFEAPRQGLHLLDMSSGEIQDLGVGTFSTWSPDGRQIAFSHA